MPGHVYFLPTSSNSSICKVGATEREDVSRRLNEINRYSYGGYNNWVVYKYISVDDCWKIENIAHRILSKYRIHNHPSGNRELFDIDVKAAYELVIKNIDNEKYRVGEYIQKNKIRKIKTISVEELCEIWGIKFEYYLHLPFDWYHKENDLPCGLKIRITCRDWLFKEENRPNSIVYNSNYKININRKNIDSLDRSHDKNMYHEHSGNLWFYRTDKTLDENGLSIFEKIKSITKELFFKHYNEQTFPTREQLKIHLKQNK